MNALELLSLPGETDSPVTLRRLVIGVGENVKGCAVSGQLLECQLLTSVHRLDWEDELRESTIGAPRLDRLNPFYTDHQLRHLDDHGLVRVGSCVAVDDLLASILVADQRPLVKGVVRPDKGMQWVTDRSICVPYGWGDAVVASARRLGRKEVGRRMPREFRERIEITLRAERALEIGDVLLIAEQQLVVNSVFSTPVYDREGHAADVLVSPALGELLGSSRTQFRVWEVRKGEIRAADELCVRSTGPYSLITQGPLSRDGAQAIHVAHVQWLAERGLTGLIGELVSLKADDVVDRQQMQSLSTLPPGSVLDIGQPAAPQSLAYLRAHLAALGLKVDLESGAGSVSIRVTPATDAEIVQRSSGEITKPETLDYRTYYDVDDGLFAPNVFGPSDWSRRQRFGHITLAAPIVSLLWRLGEPAALAQQLAMAGEDLERVLTYRADLYWENNAARVQERGATDNARGPNWLGTGAEAIQALLAARGLPTSFVTSVIPVLPPDWRPIVLLDSGNFATSDLNDLYRHIINRNNRLKKLRELNAPQVILDNEARLIQETIDTLHANSLVAESRAVYGDNGRRLKDLLELLLGIVTDDDKRVDWSGAARMIPDPAVAPCHTLVPRSMFDKLRLGEQVPVLLTTSTGGNGRFVACFPQPHDESVLRVSPETLQALAGEQPLPLVAQVHRLVTQRGLAEARQLVEAEPPCQPTPVDHQSWTHSRTITDFVARLATAAVLGETVSLSSPQNVLIGGTGSTQFAADAPEIRADQRREQVPIPPKPLAATAEPTPEQLLAIARQNVQKSCVFDVQTTTSIPPAEQGRIGGEPYLPPEIAWPTYQGKPLTFLGQFPLDVAREAGVLPIDVPPRSMLSIFGGVDCWEPGPCGERCPVFIHSLDHLTERTAPRELEYIAPLCQITPRIVEEVPDAKELAEILRDELGDIQRPALQTFLQSLPPKLAPASECVKLGGWPHWIQGADSTQPLLLQLASTDEVDFGFGDSGTLYVVVNEQDELFCLSQCY